MFNWKPYWQFDEAAKIIHFHGPKPHEYHDFQAGRPGPPIFGPIFQLCNFTSVSNGCRRWIEEVSSKEIARPCEHTSGVMHPSGLLGL